MTRKEYHGNYPIDINVTFELYECFPHKEKSYFEVFSFDRKADKIELLKTFYYECQAADFIHDSADETLAKMSTSKRKKMSAVLDKHFAANAA